jgi:hypothetical protein
MSLYTTDNISALDAQECPGGWVVHFASSNADLCHQLYVNGRLEDFSEHAEQRELFCREQAAPAQLAVAAVEYNARGQDFSSELGLSPPAWQFVRRVARSMSLRRGDRVELLWDEGSGTMQNAPVLSEEAWPAWMHRQAFGEEYFGQESFGGSALDGEPIVLAWLIGQSGTYRFLVRTRDTWGRCADSPPITFDAALPDEQDATLLASAFDQTSKTLTLSLS